MKGFRSRISNPATGRRSLVFNANQGFADLPVTIACGQCTGCRLERSRIWAIRCTHEASLYENNCFLTLTYDDDHLPYGGTLVMADFQKFMKRLRKKYGPNIRFFHCGEYGEKLGRPHYHACLFNHDFKDKVHFKTTRNGDKLYLSDELNDLWSEDGQMLGHASIGDVTFESAAYVARYVMKKVTGENAQTHYQHVDSDGVIHDRHPEYVTMSRRPGLGQGWLSKFKSDVYPSDEIILNGKKLRAPRFYDSQYEIEHPNEFRRIKNKRIVNAKKHADNNTPSRLAVRHEVHLAKIKMLKRETE